MSFTNYSLFHFDKFDFVGLKNYAKILTTGEFGTFIAVFWWTLIWSLVSVFGQFAIGLALALILNKKDFVSFPPINNIILLFIGNIP